MTINLTSQQYQKRGPGFWKFNCNLLKDINYINKINQLIERLENQYHNMEDKGLKWDLIKCMLRTETIKYCSIKSKRSKERGKHLYEQEQELSKIINLNPNNKEAETRLEQIQKEIENSQDLETKASIVRSRAMWQVYGERNSKFFMGLEK